MILSMITLMCVLLIDNIYLYHVILCLFKAHTSVDIRNTLPVWTVRDYLQQFL